MSALAYTVTDTGPAIPASLPPNLEAAHEFLAFLDPTEERFTFQVFDDSEAKRRSLARTLNGTLEQHASTLAQFNNQGAGVFVTINETDLKGREAENIKRVRAAFADTDGAPLEPIEACNLPPNGIAASSPGKWHAYWLAEGDFPLDQFKPMQKAIAARFGTDPSVNDLPRVMRLPGFYHRKAEPFLVTFETRNPFGYGADELLGEFPPAQESRKPPQRAPVALPGQLDAYTQRALDSATSTVISAPDGTRNNTLNREAVGLFGLVKAGRLPEHTAREQLERAATGVGLSAGEITATLDSAWKAAKPRAESVTAENPHSEPPPRTYTTKESSLPTVDSEPPPDTYWPTLVDPFSEYPVPAFPMDILPAAFSDFCNEQAAQSGFDPGGYAFCLLVAAANTIDHRAKLNLGPFKVPAFTWGGIVGDSGQGKSPVINATTFAAENINNAMVKESEQRLAQWYSDLNQAKSDKAEPPPKPEWKQRHALDTTTEALAQLLVENPEGVNLYHHEITEFLGRMDAYSGKDGGKDRGVYLRSYDGGHVTINRASKTPMVVDDFSVGILAGIQPEKLAHLFKKSGGGSDGLYQRFLMYCLRPAGEVDYMATENPLSKQNVAQIFDRLHEWTHSKPMMVQLSSDARRMMQDYHNSIRKLAQRTPAQRFAEHLDKFPGMLGRLVFTLHLVEAAASGSDPLRVATAETMSKARQLMGVLYRHSEAVYRVLDLEAGDVRKLVVSAAEAVLTKQWDIFKRGDLTRDATYWQGADQRQAEAALDYLIELGWLADITPAPTPGKRGRRSDGVFKVNPAAHTQFSTHAARIKEARAERFKALNAIAKGI